MSEGQYFIFYTSHAKGVCEIKTNNSYTASSLRTWAKSGEIKHDDCRTFTSIKEAKQDQKQRFPK